MQNEETQQNIHIGNLIRNELERQGRKISWFAKQINCDRSNAYKILKRDNVDIKLLIQISEALNHNFFEDCSRLVCIKNEGLQ